MILQSTLPLVPWMDPRLARLPGVVPIAKDEWLSRDDAFDAQMAYADKLLTERRDEVIALVPSDPIAEELLWQVVAAVKSQDGYITEKSRICRPDGTWIYLDSDHPLVTARRLVQEDLLIHVKHGEMHCLQSGALCFPASWMLSEKHNRSLERIHKPVEDYSLDISKRVERLFDGLSTDRPLMRANYLRYESSELFHPLSEEGPRDRGKSRYMRVERQCFKRLPVSKAVIFTIHTYIVPITALTKTQLDALPDQ